MWHIFKCFCEATTQCHKSVWMLTTTTGPHTPHPPTSSSYCWVSAGGAASFIVYGEFTALLVTRQPFQDVTVSGRGGNVWWQLLKFLLSHKYETWITFEQTQREDLDGSIAFELWFRKKLNSWKIVTRICSQVVTLLITAGWASIGVSSRLQQAWEAGREYLWDGRVIFSLQEGHGSSGRPH